MVYLMLEKDQAGNKKGKRLRQQRKQGPHRRLFGPPR